MTLPHSVTLALELLSNTCDQAPCVAVYIANMDLVNRVIWTSSTYLPGVSKVSFEFETFLIDFIKKDLTL